MSSIFFPPFFETNEYFIDEKVNFFKFHNHYKVYDNHGLPIGNIVQHVTGWHKFLRLFISKAMFPFTLKIVDADEKELISIERGWTFWMSKISIKTAEGLEIGQIKQKFKLFKPTFEIYDAAGLQIGLITGDWKAWNFVIKDANENTIGTINKKWGGVAKEFFTSADKYMVNIVPEFAEDTNKINIVSTAIIVDMVMKESK
jgi:uncharacterized protein YxjI